MIIKIFNSIIPKNKNYILFYSSFDFDDNPRAIYEKIKEMDCDRKYKLIWLVNDIERFTGLDEPAIFIKHKSIRGIWLFLRSKYVFKSHSLFGHISAVKKQKMIYCFHGMPVKLLAKWEKQYVKKIDISLLPVTSEVFRAPLANITGADINCCIPFGMARNDSLFNDDSSILQKMGLNNFDKIIIWMPTFRVAKGYSEGKQSEFGIPCLKRTDLKDLNLVLNQYNYLLIFKLHPWAADQVDCKGFSNIVNITNNDIYYPYKLYDLVGKCDALITDYSSIYYDYLLLNRPIAFAYDDIKEFNESREFLYDNIEDYLAGKKISNSTDLKAFLYDLSIGNDEYKKKRMEMISRFHKYVDNNSSERIVNYFELFDSKSNNVS